MYRLLIKNSTHIFGTQVIKQISVLHAKHRLNPEILNILFICDGRAWHYNVH